MPTRTSPPVRILQERRIRWTHGLTPSQARVIAQLAFGGNS